MIKEANPCLGCDCYDSDMGCTMSSLDKMYACCISLLVCVDCKHSGWMPDSSAEPYNACEFCENGSYYEKKENDDM